MIEQAQILLLNIRTVVEHGKKFIESQNKLNQKAKGLRLTEVAQLYRADPEVQSARQTLVDVLSELTQEQVSIIRAIMYLGQDEYLLLLREEEEEDQKWKNDPEYQANRRRALGDPNVLLIESLRYIKYDSKEVTIESILEKLKFPEWLEIGLQILKLA